MIEKVNRKSMKIRPSGRSSDFISPSFGFGCLLQCGYCITLDTLITTPTGLKKAEEIQEGDHIISFCLDSEKHQIDKVLQVALREAHELYEVCIDVETVYVTGEHPFYTKNRGWVEAKYLTEDDELLYDNFDLNQ